MRIRIDDIKVNDRIRQDYGDIQALAEDIEKNGLIQLPVISEDHVLIAGGRRLQAMKSLGWTETDVHMVSVHDEEHRLNMEISENEVRKDFTMEERLDLAKRLERIERIKAEQRMKDPMQNFAEGEKGNTRDKVAEKLDFGSGEQYRKAKYVSDHRDQLKPSEYEAWNQGAISTNKAYQQIGQTQAKPNNKRDLLYEKNKKRIETLYKDLDADEQESSIGWGKHIVDIFYAMKFIKDHPELLIEEKLLPFFGELVQDDKTLNAALTRSYLLGLRRGVEYQKQLSETVTGKE